MNRSQPEFQQGWAEGFLIAMGLFIACYLIFG